jgi:hypothetical protein
MTAGTPLLQSTVAVCLADYHGYSLLKSRVIRIDGSIFHATKAPRYVHSRTSRILPIEQGTLTMWEDGTWENSIATTTKPELRFVGTVRVAGATRKASSLVWPPTG